MKFQQNRLSDRFNPRDIIKECFDKDLPLQGGWGYTKEDCVIIDKNDSTVNPTVPFNGVGIEYFFVEKRLYIELIVARPEDDRFSGICWNLLKQELKHDGGKSYDKLTYEVTAFPDKDWNELKAEYEGQAPDFDKEAHERKRDELMVRFTCEFWFDITSFFGDYGK